MGCIESMDQRKAKQAEIQSLLATDKAEFETTVQRHERNLENIGVKIDRIRSMATEHMRVHNLSEIPRQFQRQLLMLLRSRHRTEKLLEQAAQQVASIDAEMQRQFEVNAAVRNYERKRRITDVARQLRLDSVDVDGAVDAYEDQESIRDDFVQQLNSTMGGDDDFDIDELEAEMRGLFVRKPADPSDAIELVDDEASVQTVSSAYVRSRLRRHDEELTGIVMD